MGAEAGASRVVGDDSVSFLIQAADKAAGTRVGNVDTWKMELVFRTTDALLKFEVSEE